MDDKAVIVILFAAIGEAAAILATAWIVGTLIERIWNIKGEW